MHTKPRRLKRARRTGPARTGLPPPIALARGPGWNDQLRAARRSTLLLAWTLLCIPVQAVLVNLPGPAKVRFARLYWATFCQLLGVRVRVIGTEVSDASGPVVFVSNHSSWLDIAVLGGQLPASFVAKTDVASWPLVSTVARLGRTVFVTRLRHSAARERDAMRMRIAAGDNLILFPEGTTSDGARVLPFRSALLSVAEGVQGLRVQPVSIVYDRLDGLPTRRGLRARFAYYGDHMIGPHFWRLAQGSAMRVSVVLHEPVDPSAFPDRKALSQALWAVVAAAAAELRQNRPAQPRRAVPPPPAEPAAA